VKKGRCPESEVGGDRKVLRKGRATQDSDDVKVSLSQWAGRGKKKKRLRAAEGRKEPSRRTE